MDNTIIEMFKEKNDKILIEKLLLDLNNNNDSLRLTINNKIDLVVSVKFLKKINNVLKNTEIEYDIKTLNDIVEQTKKTIKEESEKILEIRKQKIEHEIVNNFSGVENLSSTIEKSEEELKTQIETFINKLIYEQTQNNIFDLYKFKSVDQKEEVISTLKRFDSELTLNVLTPLTERNCSLKNIMKETEDKVIELNEKTTEITTGKTIKK